MMMAQFIGGKLDGQIMPVSEVEAVWCNGKHTDDLSAERKRWSRNYHLTDGFMSRFGIYFVTATPKREPIDLFNFE